MLPVLRTNSLIPAVDGPVNRISRLFDRIFDETLFEPLTAPQPLIALPLSMWEDENNFYVEVDVPGLTEKDIDVSVHHGALAIRGQRKRTWEGNGYDTRSYGEFEQRVSLPAGIHTDKVEAKLTNGVLALTFPKGEEAKPRKIALKNG